MYNDECVRSLICFACARICLDTGGFWSDIGYVSGEWLFGLPAKALKHNFSMELFQQRYCQSGTPLAPLGPGMRRPDFGEWTLEIDPEVFEHAMTSQLGEDGRGRGVLDLKETLLICCPEDHECARGCPSRTRGRQRGGLEKLRSAGSALRPMLRRGGGASAALRKLSTAVGSPRAGGRRGSGFAGVAVFPCASHAG